MEHYDIKHLMEFFEPLTEEEQKLLLFLCLDAIEDLREKLEYAEKDKRKSKTYKAVVAIQIETYLMFAEILSHSKILEQGGMEQMKDILFKEMREKYKKLYDEEDDVGGIKC